MNELIPPDKDITDRQSVWDEMQMLYMDIDTEEFLNSIATVCAASKYTIQNLKDILFKEVFPALRFNIGGLEPAPEWQGFDIAWLSERILKKQRHGMQDLLYMKGYTDEQWLKLETMIYKIRDKTQAE